MTVPATAVQEPRWIVTVFVDFPVPVAEMWPWPFVEL